LSKFASIEAEFSAPRWVRRSQSAAAETRERNGRQREKRWIDSGGREYPRKKRTAGNFACNAHHQLDYDTFRAAA
jgi:hypothetical protein